MANYKNAFYNPLYQGSALVIVTNSEPVHYRGYLIYHRIKGTTKSGNVFDVVKDGVCIGNYAGINGAKAFIDDVEMGEYTFFNPVNNG